jgi:hypothetical protein
MSKGSTSYADFTPLFLCCIDTSFERFSPYFFLLPRWSKSIAISSIYFSWSVFYLIKMYEILWKEVRGAWNVETGEVPRDQKGWGTLQYIMHGDFTSAPTTFVTTEQGMVRGSLWLNYETANVLHKNSKFGNHNYIQFRKTANRVISGSLYTLTAPLKCLFVG